MLAHCDRKPEQTTNLAPTEAPSPGPNTAPASMPTPAPTAPLTRAELVSAAGQAASAYAEGRVADGVDPLVGRGFSVRSPFGCGGPSTSQEAASADGVARWTWGPERKTIELRLMPGDWASSALTLQPGAANSSPTWEAVEGFWIPRPWLASESCPHVRGDPLQTGQTIPSPQTVGIAAVFEAGGSRAGRRNGRAYTFTIRGEGEVPPTAPAGGYRLRLEGRVVAFPDGRAVRCRAPGADQRPVCVVAVQPDKVAFEDEAGQTLSMWGPS
jgi:hypothetical protein